MQVDVVRICHIKMVLKIKWEYKTKKLREEKLNMSCNIFKQTPCEGAFKEYNTLNTRIFECHQQFVIKSLEVLQVDRVHSAREEGNPGDEEKS